MQFFRRTPSFANAQEGVPMSKTVQSGSQQRIVGHRELEPRVNEGMVGGGRWFKLLTSSRDDCRLPGAVPWALVAPHEEQAHRNHGQTLERIDQRGGLSIRELHAVCHDKHWHPVVEEAVAVEWLLALMWNGAQVPNGPG